MRYGFVGGSARNLIDGGGGGPDGRGASAFRGASDAVGSLVVGRGIGSWSSMSEAVAREMERRPEQAVGGSGGKGGTAEKDREGPGFAKPEVAGVDIRGLIAGRITRTAPGYNTNSRVSLDFSRY